MKFVGKLLLLLLFSGVKCKEITSCTGTVSINCGDHVISIRNATRSIAQDLLEQCNARHECSVPNMNNECVYVNYWCIIDISSMEIKKSSVMHMKTSQPTIGLMSGKYRKGIYQNAENINCNFIFAKHESQMQKEIKFGLHDFASFANSTDFCLSVKDSTMVPFCSGSQECYTAYGPFDMTSKNQFSITLTTNATRNTELIEVRFWFEIFVVSTQDVPLEDIECHSKPAATPRSTTAKDLNEARPIVYRNTALIFSLGTFLGVAALAVVFLIGRSVYRRCPFRCSSKTSSDSGQYADVADENDYAYIDLASMASREQLDRDDDNAPNIPKARREEAMKIKTGQSELSMNFDQNDDHVPNLGIIPNDKDDGRSHSAVPLEMPVPCKNSAEHLFAGETQDYCHSNDNNELAQECEVCESPTSQEPTDNSTLMADHDPVTAEVQVHADHADQDPSDEHDDGIVNEYTSLGTREASADGTRKDSENVYTPVEPINSNIRGACHENEPEEMPASEEPHDYLELIGDPADSDLMEAGHHRDTDPGQLEETQGNSENSDNENISLEPHDYLELIGDPDDSAQMNSEVQDDGEPGETEGNPDDKEEVMNAEMEGNAERNQSEGNASDENASEYHHDYLELIGDTDDADQEDESYTSNVNEYTSLSATEASDDTQDAYTLLGNIK